MFLREKRRDGQVVKPQKTWWDSMETFLFKSIEKILEQRDSMKIVHVELVYS